MNANDPNVAILERVAEQLGDALRQEMVFVGGSVAGLLITDPAMPAIRPTEDVDLIFEALVLADYHRFEKTLRARGFAPAFLATKLEAFDGRGQGDFLFSHDLGDLLAVVDGRDTLVDKCRASAPELQAYLGERFSGLLVMPAFIEALAGHLPGDAASQERLPDIEAKLRQIAELATS